MEDRSPQPATPIRLLRHVVLIKFKVDANLEKLKEIENAFCALPNKINIIYDFEWGIDVSVEGKTQGFTHCFMVTFRSEADRDAYIPHPSHEEFGVMMRSYLEKILVLDYWVKS